MIWGFAHGKAGRFREPRGCDTRVLRMRVDARADRRPAESNPGELVDGDARAADRLLHLSGVALELLPEPDRSRVLEVCAAGLDHRPELLALRLERFVQTLQGWNELVVDRHRGRELDGSRDVVVGGLAKDHVVVGMDQA